MKIRRAFYVLFAASTLILQCSLENPFDQNSPNYVPTETLAELIRRADSVFVDTVEYVDTIIHVDTSNINDLTRLFRPPAPGPRSTRAIADHRSIRASKGHLLNVDVFRFGQPILK